MINPINMPADFVAGGPPPGTPMSPRSWLARNVAQHVPLRRKRSQKVVQSPTTVREAGDLWSDTLRRFNESRLVQLVKNIDEDERDLMDDEFSKMSLYSAFATPNSDAGSSYADDIPEHAIRFHRRSKRGKRGAEKDAKNKDKTAKSDSVIKPIVPIVVGSAKKVDDRPDGPLDLNWIDLKARQNARAHHTNEFEMVRAKVKPALVVRRGQAFDISMSMWRPINTEHDIIKLVAETGAHASTAKGTRISIDCEEGNEVAGWKIESVKVTGWRVQMSVKASVYAPVGRWSLKIITQLKHDTSNILNRLHGFFSYEHTPGECTECSDSRETPVDDFYLLFNPWCQDDTVYMPSESDRDEYVMNDVGKIWRGTHNAERPTYWAYGQFDEGVLEASIYLLEISNLRPATRCDSVHVARTVSEMVNSNDDRGVIMGKWDGDYDMGTVPTAWTGSSAILRQYIQSKQSVQYGQCWVFAGVACTIFRALGIPCRVVTNYSSAHDTDTNCTVDVHLSAETGKLDESLNKDSVWNFHVWNDIWMTRPDLPGGHDGWQAVDATPQEKSNGMYRVGPASVEAVRRGEVSLSYDTMFVFSEVNADKVYWMVDLRGDAQLNDIRTKDIGRKLLTKKAGRRLVLGNDDVRDITHEYKHEEGTQLERSAVHNALLVGHHDLLKHYSSDINSNTTAAKSVNVELILGKEKTKIGHELTAYVKATNLSNEERRCKTAIRVNAVTYTGELGTKIKSDLRAFTLKPKGEALIPVTVSVYEYVHKLSEQASFLFTVTNVVLETAEVFATTDDIRLIMPDIEFQLADTPELDQKCKARVRLENPLPISLHNCRFMVEGPGVMNTITLHCNDVPGGGMAVAPFVFTPWKSGERHLVARFESDQLRDVDGELTINVKGVDNL